MGGTIRSFSDKRIFINYTRPTTKVGVLLCEYMRKNELTLKELCVKLGMSKDTVSDHIRGLRKPQEESLELYSILLGVPTKKLREKKK